MDSRVRLFVVLTVATLSGGCGTISNTLDCDVNPPFRYVTPPSEMGTHRTLGDIYPLWRTCEENQKRIYGGVKADCSIFGIINTTIPNNGVDPWLAVLDMPFSAIGDTIALPYILAYRNGLFGDVKEKPATP